MRLILRHAYKSLKPPYDWGVPDFAFLTGLNGAGKTHLVECLNLALSRNNVATIEGARIHQREHLYLPSGWELPGHDGHVAHDKVAATIKHAAGQVRVNYNSDHPLWTDIAAVRAKISELTGRDYKQLSDEELLTPR